MTRHVLVVRPDNAGDVLLTGPAVRSIAHHADRVTVWAGPHGAAAARLLPGVDAVYERRVPWIDLSAATPDRSWADAVVDELTVLEVDEAVVFTSFHQSPLPTALVLRMAGVARVGAISVDFPGSLLDVRHRLRDDVHEVERALSLTDACGFPAPPGDDLRLRVRAPLPTNPVRDAGRYVVVHPGASVPARTWAPQRHAAAVEALAAEGWHVVVTGSSSERDLTREVAGPRSTGVIDLTGATDLAGLAAVIADADAVVVGNTGPAHLAAAVGTPVVSLFAPTVPAVRWRPWGVPNVLLGDQEIACAGCRARSCPVPGHPCLGSVTPADVVAAVRQLTSPTCPTDGPTPHRPLQEVTP